MFSSDLKWRHHYEYIITKALKILGLLRRRLTSSNCTNTNMHIYSEILFALLLETMAPHEGHLEREPLSLF